MPMVRSKRLAFLGRVGVGCGPNNGRAAVSARRPRKMHVGGISMIGVRTREREEELPMSYEPDRIQRYWDSRMGEMTSRWKFFLSMAVPYGTKILNYSTRGTIRQNEAELARELRIILEEMGPTFVKFGQVSSTRPDIVGETVMNELALLQDAVKPFSNEEARQVMQEELGRPVDEVFYNISEEPIAAASLAQVYRAQLKETDEWVAIKVQRPNLLPMVSRDLYVMKKAAEWNQQLMNRFTKQKTDYVALLEAWATGFYEELDFKNEAENQNRFTEMLVSSKIEGVRIPKVYDDLCSRRLLVSEWIDGKKLSSAPNDQLRRLTKVGATAFLTQLLDFGYFHGDPHSGNLLAVDGTDELCILDFGLVARVPQADRDTLVSSIIHLANQDFSELTNDLIRLNFLPETVDRSRVEGVMERVLSPYVTQGGGAKNLNVSALIQEMTTALLDIEFSIPPYYALVGRALITLEGIALQGDPDYKMVMESYPYVANRILSEEDSPELRKALSEILYGDGGKFSVSRLLVLINAAMGAVDSQSNSFLNLDRLPTESSSMEDVVRFIIGQDAKAVQDALLPEVVDAIDMLARRNTKRSVQTFISAAPGPLQGRVKSALRLDSVLDACELTKSEEIYLQSLLEFVAQASDVDLRNAPSNPLELAQAGAQLPRLVQKAASLDETERASLASLTERVARGVADKAYSRARGLFSPEL